MAKYLFVVQGEGRGHMTQAISMRDLLTSSGHELCSVLVGSSSNREIPGFFYDKIAAPVIPFASPNFVVDGRNKSIKIVPSVLKNMGRLGTFRKSIRLIHQQVVQHRPDVIINFYDPLVGLYYLFHRPRIPMLCVGHQYLMTHPAFPYPKGHTADRISLKLYTNLTAIGATKRLALSFYELPSHKRVSVIPPLLRKEVYSASVSEGDYFLVYLVNSGYSEEIIRWNEKNPRQQLHCFWDKKDAPEEFRQSATLTFHRLDDQKFIKLMAGCKAFISTAGFESICEAMYFGKPVFMVPVGGHFEQLCNAIDAEIAGAGIYDTHFSIDKLLQYLPHHTTSPDIFRNWANTLPTRFPGEIHAVTEQRSSKAAFVNA
ncbi:MAG: glycosyltransferase family protein [Bacteroidia bacterium]